MSGRPFEDFVATVFSCSSVPPPLPSPPPPASLGFQIRGTSAPFSCYNIAWKAAEDLLYRTHTHTHTHAGGHSPTHGLCPSAPQVRYWHVFWPYFAISPRVVQARADCCLQIGLWFPPNTHGLLFLFLNAIHVRGFFRVGREERPKRLIWTLYYCSQVHFGLADTILFKSLPPPPSPTGYFFSSGSFFSRMTQKLFSWLFMDLWMIKFCY